MVACLVPVLTVMLVAVSPRQVQAASASTAQADSAHAATVDGPADPQKEDGDLPVSVDRIKKKLAEPPAIKVKTEGTVFRVEVLGRKPTIEDILGPDYLKGPMPAGAPTHQEFLDLVTPKDVQGYAAFDNKEALTVAATSFAAAFAIQTLQKAIHKLQQAKESREREAARQEVQNALADLEKARIAAGLPPK